MEPSRCIHWTECIPDKKDSQRRPTGTGRIVRICKNGAGLRKLVEVRRQSEWMVEKPGMVPAVVVPNKQNDIRLVRASGARAQKEKHRDKNDIFTHRRPQQVP